MFIKRIKPWSGGGGGNNVVPPPTDVIISNTLLVEPSGSDTQIELINAFSALAFVNPLIAAAYSNNACAPTEDFTIGPPTGGADGAVINFSFASGIAGNVVMSIDSSIAVPDALTSEFPFTITENGFAYLTLTFDGQFQNSWYISNFNSVGNG